VTPDWLNVRRGGANLIVSIPHAGTKMPGLALPALRSLWLARMDADWWLTELYAFAEAMDATIIRTEISRTIIDVNRDPSGMSLYPGQATTGLCPAATFDGEPLYNENCAPDDAEIAERRERYFNPYHGALASEITRLKAIHGSVVLYDCHSIRSEISRLFDGVLPNFNIGTDDGKSCNLSLTETITSICAANRNYTHIVNGRFKGGYITRHYGDPANGVNAIQMELACRGYMVEPETPDETNWPSPYDPDYATPMQKILKIILESLLP
jgi:N-formylglutamate deformylase